MHSGSSGRSRGDAGGGQENFGVAADWTGRAVAGTRQGFERQGVEARAKKKLDSRTITTSRFDATYLLLIYLVKIFPYTNQL